MATYKVLQDIEAEDKLVGPLTLRQFIYAGICALCLYLTFLTVSKHVGFLAVLFLPVAAFTGFFAFPWGRDQPTELWALAKIRFMLKPRKRIWDQSGVKELVTITVPKQVEHQYTDGLSQTEVHSRLHALADTIDSRGWAIKNVNVNLYSQPGQLPSQASDRLLDMSSLPQEVTSVDVAASDDMLDPQANPVAHHFNDMITAQAQSHRQQLVAQLQQDDSVAVAAPATGTSNQPAPTNYWFLNQPTPVPGQATFVDSAVVTPGSKDEPAAVPQAVNPTAEEAAMVEKFKAENSSMQAAYGHTKVVKPLSEQTAAAPPQNPAPAVPPPASNRVTAKDTTAIMNLASNNDLNVATIAREANRKQGGDQDEVVISLH
jgi:hypothetical protein